MRRKDKEMPESFALQVADSALWAVMSLVDSDNNPYGVPINIVRKDKNIYFHSAKQGFKLDCLAHQKKVCLTCVGDNSLAPMEFTTKYQSSILRGVAIEVMEDEEKVMALRILGEKFAPSNVEKLQGEIHAFLSQTSVWKIEIESATGKENK